MYVCSRSQKYSKSFARHKNYGWVGSKPDQKFEPKQFYQETEQTHKTRTNPQYLNKPNPRTEKTQTRSTHNKTFFMRKPNLTFILKSDLHSSDS